jgi:hypothetical protein
MNAAPLQMAAGVNVVLRTGIGFTTTVTLKVAGLVQPLALTVYTYVTVVLVVFVVVNVSPIAPVPEFDAGDIPPTAARVHANVVPEVALPGV